MLSSGLRDFFYVVYTLTCTHINENSNFEMIPYLTILLETEEEKRNCEKHHLSNEKTIKVKLSILIICSKCLPQCGYTVPLCNLNSI